MLKTNNFFGFMIGFYCLIVIQKGKKKYKGKDQENRRSPHESHLSSIKINFFFSFFFTICEVENRTSNFEADSISTMLIELCSFWPIKNNLSREILLLVNGCKNAL